MKKVTENPSDKKRMFTESDLVVFGKLVANAQPIRDVRHTEGNHRRRITIEEKVETFVKHYDTFVPPPISNREQFIKKCRSVASLLEELADIAENS